MLGRVSDVEPDEMNPTNEENTPKALKEELEKIESVSIETDRDDKEEANPSTALPVDNTAAALPPSTEPMTE
ncbi:hypothetical protein GOBAR_AA29011 [Gossypium barbadense]|uniref:Uncharacterized protein n=1 Tax=Gossypium barbadense TaxID=3634 RepID=A0A2P5WKT0_GOSBA|nr:hypothetical protein GOBAR_AA29011 [Gossypium barbadense]